MSELSSLYVKVKISQAQLARFKRSRPVAPALTSNWTNWWDTREMYGKEVLHQVQSYHAATYGDIINELKEQSYHAANDHYDLEKGCWYFYVLQFSENFTEIIPMIAMLKDLANFLDSDASGLAILYDFLWGDKELMFELQYQGKEAKLSTAHRTGALNAPDLEEANQLLEAWTAELSKRYDD